MLKNKKGRSSCRGGGFICKLIGTTDSLYNHKIILRRLPSYPIFYTWSVHTLSFIRLTVLPSTRPGRKVLRGILLFLPVLSPNGYSKRVQPQTGIGESSGGRGLVDLNPFSFNKRERGNSYRFCSTLKYERGLFRSKENYVGTFARPIERVSQLPISRRDKNPSTLGPTGLLSILHGTTCHF